MPYAPAVDKEKVAPLVSIGQYLLIGGAILLIFTAGRKTRSYLERYSEDCPAFMMLFRFKRYPFVFRLLALGLASAIIASIVNQMAVMFDMPIVFKVIMAVAIRLWGMALTSLLMRWVHMFTLAGYSIWNFRQVFTGGGEPFSPLKANTKYITVKSDAGV